MFNLLPVASSEVLVLVASQALSRQSLGETPTGSRSPF